MGFSVFLWSRLLDYVSLAMSFLSLMNVLHFELIQFFSALPLSVVKQSCINSRKRTTRAVLMRDFGEKSDLFSTCLEHYSVWKL